MIEKKIKCNKCGDYYPINVIHTCKNEMSVCPSGKYKGQPCACVDCHPEDGVCVSSESGGGCGACDGPINEHCDLVNYE